MAIICPAYRAIWGHLYYLKKRSPPRKRHCSQTSNRGCPAAMKINRHLRYLRKAPEYREYSTRWRLDNPDKVHSWSQQRKEYFGRPEVKARMLERSLAWAVANREKVNAASVAYRKRNKALYTHYSNERRARKLNATPKWLTEKNWLEIRAKYEEAARLTSETGVQHEVDHIVPLKGGTVCGLHVPWNLRVITMVENRRRPRIWSDDNG